jgi:hypothetical protein
MPPMSPGTRVPMLSNPTTNDRWVTPTYVSVHGRTSRPAGFGVLPARGLGQGGIAPHGEPTDCWSYGHCVACSSKSGVCGGITQNTRPPGSTICQYAPSL